MKVKSANFTRLYFSHFVAFRHSFTNFIILFMRISSFFLDHILIYYENCLLFLPFLAAKLLELMMVGCQKPQEVTVR